MADRACQRPERLQTWPTICMSRYRWLKTSIKPTRSRLKGGGIPYSFKAKKIGVLGLSFKATDDLRNSPAWRFIETLLAKDSTLIYDKNVQISRLTGTTRNSSIAIYPPCQTDDRLPCELFENSDILIVATKEKEFTAPSERWTIKPSSTLCTWWSGDPVQAGLLWHKLVISCAWL